MQIRKVFICFESLGRLMRAFLRLIRSVPTYRFEPTEVVKHFTQEDFNIVEAHNLCLRMNIDKTICGYIPREGKKFYLFITYLLPQAARHRPRSPVR